jgi:cytochrome bd quinol oxidase subunit 2 apoprotein (EC 1.10.3.-)
VPLAVAALSFALLKFLEQRRNALPFICALGLFLVTFGGLGVSIFPYIVPESVTIWDAAAPLNSQLFLIVGVGVLVPIILAYTAYSYWVFRGKVDMNAGYHSWRGGGPIRVRFGAGSAGSWLSTFSASAPSARSLFF